MRQLKLIYHLHSHSKNRHSCSLYISTNISEKLAASILDTANVNAKHYSLADFQRDTLYYSAP
jgi:hypothetical protein